MPMPEAGKYRRFVSRLKNGFILVAIIHLVVTVVFVNHSVRLRNTWCCLYRVAVLLSSEPLKLRCKLSCECCGCKSAACVIPAGLWPLLPYFTNTWQESNAQCLLSFMSRLCFAGIVDHSSAVVFCFPRPTFLYRLYLPIVLSRMLIAWL